MQTQTPNMLVVMLPTYTHVNILEITYILEEKKIILIIIIITRKQTGLSYCEEAKDTFDEYYFLFEILSCYF